MKKIISIGLILMMILNSLTLASSGDSYQDGYNKGYNDGYSDGSSETYKPREPNIIFETQEKLPEVAAGGNLNLIIEYKYDSQYVA